MSQYEKNTDDFVIGFEYVDIDKTFRYALNGVFGPFVLAGILGNIIILYIVGYKASKRFGSDAAICTMAVLDIVNAPIVIWNLSIFGDKGSHSVIACKIYGPLLPFLIQASTWFKAYVSYSRMR